MANRYDIFISYAQVDNQEFLDGEPATCWVNTLRHGLQQRVDQLLGRKGDTRIWMDLGGLAGNAPVTPEIHAALKESATLVVVFSRGYIQSEWCRQEREHFAAAAGSLPHDRVFLVVSDEVPRAEWPREFADLIGYTFCRKDPFTGVVTRLGDPKPTCEDKDYFFSLQKLRADLATTIRRLREGTLVTPAPSVSEGTSSKGNGPRPCPPTVGSPEPNPRPAGRTVFLAETATDREILADRRSISDFLEAEACHILPARFYRRAVDAYVQDLDRDLAAASVFVQLLGPVGTLRTDDFPEGLEGLQLARARALGKPIFRWRSKVLNPASLEDSGYRSFIEADDVMAMDLEDFKTTLVQALRRVEARREISAPSGTNPFVLINAAHADQSIADQIGDELDRQHVGFDIFADETALDDALAAEPCDGVVVVYGQCEQAWVQDRVRSLRRLLLDKKALAPACSVFVGPPTVKVPLRCRFQGLHVIEGPDATRIRPFVEDMAKRQSAE